MSTSANVTHYTVTNANTGQVVGRYRQNHLCKNTVTEALDKHKPPGDFNLKVEWPDEDEVTQLVYDGSLEGWMRQTVKKKKV